MSVNDFIVQARNTIKLHHSFTTQLSDEQLKKLIETTCISDNYFQRMSTRDKLLTLDHIFYSFRGLDVLQPLISDKSITEIMINNENEIFIERHGQIEKSNFQFESRQRLEDIIQTIVGQVNRIVNESSPIVDARLADGSRINIVLPPVALKGPCMTVRKFPEQVISMDQLIFWESITTEAALFLEELVKAKYNIFIGGGTGSGKTTFLNTLSQYIPSHERIITIEDAAELQINSVPNLVSLETRNANTEGKGEISIRDLIKASLRMRPNRIIVGEVRGKEALDMLSAMNTGHEGSMSTGHANNVRDMLSRLETMVLSGFELPLQVVRQQICSAIDIMIHLSRFHDGRRGVTEISQLTTLVNGEIKVEPLFERTMATQFNLVRTSTPLFRTEKLKQWQERM